MVDRYYYHLSTHHRILQKKKRQIAWTNPSACIFLHSFKYLQTYVRHPDIQRQCNIVLTDVVTVIDILIVWRIAKSHLSGALCWSVLDVWSPGREWLGELAAPQWWISHHLTWDVREIPCKSDRLYVSDPLLCSKEMFGEIFSNILKYFPVVSSPLLGDCDSHQQHI